MARIAVFLLAAAVFGAHSERLRGAPSSSSPHDARLHKWLDLTRELFKAGDFPRRGGVGGRWDGSPYPEAGPNVSVLRRILNDWNTDLARKPTSLLLADGAKQAARCAETGDGHFLKENFGAVCKSMLSLDKYDPKADVKLDLNLLPSQASPDVKKAVGTIDLLLSNQVFEHLKKPTIGLANLNALLRTGGTLIFTVPFVIGDHQYAEDYFRYTVRNVNNMLSCAGFTVKKLQGHGSVLTALAYQADVPSSWLSEEERSPVCDGLDKATNFCGNVKYMMVEAVAIKSKDLTDKDVQACFM